MGIPSIIKADPVVEIRKRRTPFSVLSFLQHKQNRLKVCTHILLILFL
jgi:hypothetical protein